MYNRWLVVVVLAGIISPALESQATPRSPGGLIRLLIDRAWRERRGADFECGRELAQEEEDRATAASLVEFGNAALPDLEKVLNSLQKDGENSEYAINPGVLLLAYASIRGRDAYARLHVMVGDPRLEFLQPSVDGAITIALDLTSYISSSEPLEDGVICRALDPRDSLDRLILAWEKDDRDKVQADLGPVASAALLSVLEKSGPWESMRLSFWPAPPGRIVSVGYRFLGAGVWSKPLATLETVSRPTKNPDAATGFGAMFTDASGAPCGQMRIRFSTLPEFPNAPRPWGAVRYVVDNADIGDVLHVIGLCAAR